MGTAALKAGPGLVSGAPLLAITPEALLGDPPGEVGCWARVRLAPPAPGDVWFQEMTGWVICGRRCTLEGVELLDWGGDEPLGTNFSR